MRKRTMVLGLLLLCASFAALQWIRTGRSPEPPAANISRPAALSRAEQAADTGVSARAVDPATRAYKGGWFIGEGQKFADLADQSEEAWLLATERPGRGLDVLERWMTGVTDDRLMLKTYDCERAHLLGLAKMCDFRMRMVVKRTGPDTGKLLFVKPTSDAPLDEQCRAYSDCLAHSVYLGSEVPFPAANGDTLAVHQGHRMLPSDSTQAQSQAQLRSSLKEIQADLAKMLESPDSEPREIERLEYLIKFLELRKEDPQ